MEFKLLIIEPWEFGTANGVGPFIVSLKRGIINNWLVVFEKEIIFKGLHTKYLLAKTQKKNEKIDLEIELFEKLILEMAAISDIDELNFKEYDLSDFRGEFLTGELSNHHSS
jgi:hypothetical protein